MLNAAARLVFAGRIHDHVTPLLKELHWLRALQRITYKLAMIVYRYLHGLAPQYLASELTRVADIESHRRLRSAATARLDVPSVQRSTIGGRAFPVAAAVAWNSLPVPSSVTSSASLETFRRMQNAQDGTIRQKFSNIVIITASLFYLLCDLEVFLTIMSH